MNTDTIERKILHGMTAEQLLDTVGESGIDRLMEGEWNTYSAQFRQTVCEAFEQSLNRAMLG